MAKGTRKSPKKTVEEPKQVEEIMDDNEDTDDDYSNIPSSFKPSSPNGIAAEEIFYQPRTRGRKSVGKDDVIYGQSHCVQVSQEQFHDQSIYYTNQQLENLSREIRRHPSIAMKSYHFLSRGISTKILHQIIRITLSTIFMLLLVYLLFKIPLPYLSSPTTINSGTSTKGLHSTRLTPFKQCWKEFSIEGISNFLCQSYNFNPFDSMTVDNKIPIINRPSPSSNDQGNVHYDGLYNPDLKNVRIFTSTVFFGILFFAIWLFTSRLAEKEIILDSNIILQIVHSIQSIFIIPLLNIIFLTLVLLYFIQTLFVGPHQTPPQHCISKITSNLNELSSFSPLRELLIGTVGIAMRLVNYFFQLPTSTIKLNPSDSVSDYQMKALSFVWCVVIGSILYHFGMVISYLYSIFRERTVKPIPVTKAPNSPNANASGSAPSSSVATTSSNSASTSGANNVTSLLHLDLKFLPSFIPEVLLTQNFIIVFLWTIVSCYLWRYGSPIPETHEGEIFCIFLSTSALLQSIYQLLVILQKKDVIEKLQKESELNIPSEEESEEEK